jgi:hypothetical protein
VIKRLGLLIGGTLGLWLVVALAGRALWGESFLLYSATAAALCLVPTIATLAWAGWALHRSPEQQLVMVLGGTGVRMFFVFLCGWALYRWVPFFQEHNGFWTAVLIFYLITLSLEMVLLVSGRSVPGGQG